MDSKSFVASDSDIEKHLDDFFGPDNPTGLSAVDSKMESPSESPLTSLKSIVLSMDWEITDPILKEFNQELKRLNAVFQQDGIVMKSLQILEAIGKYIQKNKSRTHPDSIRLLQSIYRDLEILLLSKGISETVRRNILIDEVAQFMKLKKKLAVPFKPTTGYLAGETEIATTSPGSPSSEPAPQAKIVSDSERVSSLEAVLHALEEIKNYIHTEFSTLRAELKLLRKSG
ncbi:MAG: hypothetical protein NTU74_14335 [Deltaproteobacteria bacterium]|nr:hypothetical protein [Deltaproteobacteria bacterium]